MISQYGHMVRSVLPRSRVDEIRLLRGLSNAELARRSGIESSAQHKIISGKRGLAWRVAQQLAGPLAVAVEDLFAPVGTPISAPEPVTVSDASRPRTVTHAPLSRDIPVYGTAQAGPEGSFLLNMGDPIDWARRPPNLIDVAGIFAIYVEGDSMAPWRQPGDLVFVHEARPAAPGCHVIAEVWSPARGQPPRAFLKRLLRRTANRIELEQYNPPAVIELAAERVGRLYRVMEWPEVLGI